VVITPGRSIRHDGEDLHSLLLEIRELSGRLHSSGDLPLTTQLEAPLYSSGFSSEYKMAKQVLLQLFSSELLNEAGKSVAWLFCTHMFWVTSY